MEGPDGLLVGLKGSLERPGPNGRALSPVRGVLGHLRKALVPLRGAQGHFLGPARMEFRGSQVPHLP